MPRPCAAILETRQRATGDLRCNGLRDNFCTELFVAGFRGPILVSSDERL